jgi:hypothetical protein
MISVRFPDIVVVVCFFFLDHRDLHLAGVSQKKDRQPHNSTPRVDRETQTLDHVSTRRTGNAMRQSELVVRHLKPPLCLAPACSSHHAAANVTTTTPLLPP